jgi:hypothetical protein
MSRILFLALVLVYPLSLSAQSTPEFPTEDEITTLMQQANFGMKQYQIAMQEEATKISNDAESNQRNKNTAENWQFLMSVVKTKPDNFNSGVGFMIVDQLNSAYQDALTCEVNALAKGSIAFVLKQEDQESAAKDVANTCMNAAQLLAIVKVSATKLYTKYLQAHKVLYERSLSAVTTCTEALRKVTPK